MALTTPWPQEYRGICDEIRRLHGDSRVSQEEIMQRYRMSRRQVAMILRVRPARAA